MVFIDNKKYVADVFDIDRYISKGQNKFFLIAGVGSGKSTWVKDVLTKKGSVLFVTSRKAKAEADISNSTFTDVIKRHTTNNQTLVTNAGLAKRIENIAVNSSKDLDDFINHFDYIIIDEVHSLVVDSLFASSCQTVLSFIERVAELGRPIVCMTGTPAPIQYYFKEKGWQILNYLNICNYVHPSEVIMTIKCKVIANIQEASIENKIIYFANRTDTIVKLSKELMDADIFEPSEIAISVSKGREEEFFDKLTKSITDELTREALRTASKDTYNSIIESKSLPDKCRILFSTSTLKEGIDIENANVVMFCESHDLSSLIQYFGRVRKGKIKIYIIEDSSDHQVQPNNLLYDYAIKKEVNAANQYLKENLTANNDPFAAFNQHNLQEHVSKNPYIFFDSIKREFKVHHMKFQEELRLSYNQYWKSNVRQHCFDYDITFIFFDEISKDALKRMAQKKDRYYEDRINLIRSLLYRAYKIDNKTPQKINTALEELNSCIRIHHGKESKGKYRNKKFWQVLFVEDFALI